MPAPLNNSSAAVVDVLLSKHARGYRNMEFIGHNLFPRAPVSNRAMRVIKFGKEGFRMINARRAPGAGTKRVQYGYASDPIGLVQDSLEGLVPIEHQQEAQSVPGINLGANAVNMVLDIMDLGLEYEISQLALNAATYADNNKLALTGSDKWSDPSSDPAADVKAGREAIRRMIGRYPNVFPMGASVFNILTQHPKIKEQFKFTSADSITADMLARYFEVEKVLVGKAVYLPEDAKDDEPATDIWGNAALLAYVPQAGEGNFQVPSFGYTYELNGYPQVEQPYYDRNQKSWIYPTTIERRPHLTGAEGGFLFPSPIAV